MHDDACETRGNMTDVALREVAILLVDGHSTETVRNLVGALVDDYHGRPRPMGFDLRDFRFAVAHPATRGNDAWENSRDWAEEYVKTVRAYGRLAAKRNVTDRIPLETMYSGAFRPRVAWVAFVNAAGLHQVPVEDVSDSLEELFNELAHLAPKPRHGPVPARKSWPTEVSVADWADILNPVLAAWAAYGKDRTMRLLRAGVSFTEAHQARLDDDTLDMMAALRTVTA